MIEYPILEKDATIGITAPSSGVDVELHDLVKQACRRMESNGFRIQCGETVWTQDKAKSAPAKKRAIEINGMLQDESIELIIPPWGGELLIEILEEIDFEKIKPKWILGYSDLSVLLLAITLKTGMATAHGTNLIDLRGEYSDDTTAMWKSVLSTKSGDSILQNSSANYQKEWQHDNPTPCIFHLTEQTDWKTVTNKNEKIQGRLLGGCIDAIRHLIGTPFGDVKAFSKQFIDDEPVIWYFENCELPTTDLRRSIVQMKLTGWFENCSGIMFGRSAANQPVGNYMIEDVYQELADELRVPIIYDIDCGHVPPQLTFINGAYADVEVKDGTGTVLQSFK
ncbi:muramoyltetrapeptide carboxypeptidase LdcA involved in peptidoglycan recycling [Bacillus pakistanensis]|uniref:Muramoyltetrapeptide carboxypeptidase LdcA involved in peptidoglycan recycling n=1 Tax=Rossellomorea pakistanensis TaxID=992288 RepID=A0ABS2N6Q6_9BACI|nr:S66 peptidase family protein [Bacillus pakistanensis]MBM7583525.1 muramoyltetrapeptide carboxypeptidase LdcA involved in peptidoglycan recycling [Bacillus pakistanensis]